MQTLPDPQPLQAWANTLTVISVLLLFILAGYLRWIAWGYQLKEKDAEIERLRVDNAQIRAECERIRAEGKVETRQWQDLSQTNKQQLDRLISLFEQRRVRQ